MLTVMLAKPQILMGGLILALCIHALLPTASAQQVTIGSSALDERFFGEGMLQVIVEDPSADDDSTDTLTLTVDLSSSDGDTSQSITIPDTNPGSQRFEFFIVHVNATDTIPDDPETTAALTGDQILLFGDGAAGATELAVTGLELYDDASFDIIKGNEEVTVDYEETLGTIELDRSSYGSNSIVYMTIVDQDANLDPTSIDEFTVDPDNPPNADLLSVNGGSLDGVVVFRETGDNTARFEGRYQLGDSISVTSESIVLTLLEKANYAAALGAAENDSNSSDEVSFTVGDSDPSIDVGGQPGILTFDALLSSSQASYVLGETITVTVVDADANIGTNMADTIILELSSAGLAELSALETGPSTGIFESSFMLGSDGAITGTDVKVENGTIAITYADKRPADYAEKVRDGQNPEKEFSLRIDVVPGSNSLVASTPSVRRIDGSTGPHLLGIQLVLSTIVENNFDAQEYVVIIEARDENGITVFLGLHSGTLASDDSSSIEASWTPEATGSYQIRTFVVSSLEGGQVLSGVSISDTAVI